MSDIKVYTANINDLWEIPSDEVGMENSSQFVRFNDFDKMTKENAQLKADNAHLIKALNEIKNLPSNRMDEGSTIAYMAIKKTQR